MKQFFGLFIAAVILAVVTIVACNKNVDTQPFTVLPNLPDQQFVKENLSFYDVRVRSLSEESYVVEILMVNFSNQPSKLSESFSFQNSVYSDNGKGNDLVAHDGLYTSVEEVNHDRRIPHDRAKTHYSVMKNPVVDSAFKYRSNIEGFESNYSFRKGGLLTRVFEITCKVTLSGNCHGYPCNYP